MSEPTVDLPRTCWFCGEQTINARCEGCGHHRDDQ